MHRRSLLAVASSVLAFAAFGTSIAASEYRVSGPFVHENLAIYLVHGPSAPGAVPLTLEEAMAKKLVRVHETGNVNQLEIENLGNDEVFVQSGDIVKGGQQDRALTVSLILPPRSGRIPIASFCVEQSRWSARGREDARVFSTAAAAVPSREVKIAMKAPLPAPSPGAVVAGRTPAFSEVSARQGEVWRKVKSVQDGLSANVGTTVNAPTSQSSLQLALENEKLRDAQATYIKALQAKGEQEGDVVGYIFAINGKLNSADVYPSNGLFRKMWGKLLRTSTTEAIGVKNAGADALPSTATALAFLTDAMQGAATEKTLTERVSLETRDSDRAFYFETRRASGGWVHRNYLAK